MNIELKILDWFQTLHTPVLDKFMTSDYEVLEMQGFSGSY